MGHYELITACFFWKISSKKALFWGSHTKICWPPPPHSSHLLWSFFTFLLVASLSKEIFYLILISDELIRDNSTKKKIILQFTLLSFDTNLLKSGWSYTYCLWIAYWKLETLSIRCDNSVFYTNALVFKKLKIDQSSLGYILSCQ